MEDRGPWKIKSSKDVYADPWLRVRRDEVVRPDGEPGSHCIVYQKEGVSVLAVDDQGVAHLTREFHYALGEYALEVVSGGCDDGEAPLETAKRELEEELGIVAIRWTKLTTVHPFTSIVHSPTTLFLAESLSFVEARPEGTERIERVEMPFDEALRAVEEGGIVHAPSCVAILMTARLRSSS